MRKIFKKKKLIMAFSLSLSLLSCSFYDDPEGKVEILDVYTRYEQGYREDYFTFGSSTSKQHEYKTEEVLISYLCTTVKITNTCDKKIYNTTINIQANAGERTYYKTISLDVIIKPGESIYIPIEIEKYTKELKAVGSSNDADWDINSIQILSVNWS